MGADTTRKAIDMLLSGATMVGEPCPYCGGVRVIKDGRALCAGCGREPEERPEPPAAEQAGAEERLAALASGLALESDGERRKAMAAEIERLAREIAQRR